MVSVKIAIRKMLDFTHHHPGSVRLVKPISTIRWLGGKTPLRATGAFVLDNMPYPPNHIFLDPFMGSCAAALNRMVVRNEIVNDLDGNLVNFWKHLRNPTFIEMCEDTLNNRAEFEEVKRSLDEGTPLERAYKYWFVAETRAAFARPFHQSQWAVHKMERTASCVNRKDIVEAKYAALRERIRYWHIDNRPAERMLELHRDVEHIDVYCDPPYYSTLKGGDTVMYENMEIDVDRFTELFLSMRGRVIVSGTESEWDHLGWRKESIDVYASLRDVGSFGEDSETHRSECVWMNYPPNGGVVEEKLFV